MNKKKRKGSQGWKMQRRERKSEIKEREVME